MMEGAPWRYGQPEDMLEVKKEFNPAMNAMVYSYAKKQKTSLECEEMAWYRHENEKGGKEKTNHGFHPHDVPHQSQEPPNQTQANDFQSGVHQHGDEQATPHDQDYWSSSWDYGNGYIHDSYQEPWDWSYKDSQDDWSNDWSYNDSRDEWQYCEPHNESSQDWSPNQSWEDWSWEGWSNNETWEEAQGWEDWHDTQGWTYTTYNSHGNDHRQLGWAKTGWMNKCCMLLATYEMNRVHYFDKLVKQYGGHHAMKNRLMELKSSIQKFGDKGPWKLGYLD